MKLLFTGDINFFGQPTPSREAAAETFSEVLPFVQKADFVVPNLECALADMARHQPIKKAGPPHGYDKAYIAYLQALRADAVTLANNHTGDYGPDALRETLALLDQNGMAHAGAGETVFDAYQAAHLRHNGTTVAILSVCEHEFGLADEHTPGSAAYNPRLLLKQIAAEKEQASFVVVVFHGGNEFNPLPSPDTVERYRLVIDMGADAVIAGHTHCPQGYETYNGKPIIYSMGNFLFKSGRPREASDAWHYGYFTMLNLEKSGVSFEVIPYRFDVEATRISVFCGAKKAGMMTYLENLSRIIADRPKLTAYFKGWAWIQKWCPVLPPDYDNLAAYNASGNYDLTICEAHASLTKYLFEIFFNDECSLAEQMAREIRLLQKMPV